MSSVHPRQTRIRRYYLDLTRFCLFFFIQSLINSPNLRVIPVVFNGIALDLFLHFYQSADDVHAAQGFGWRFHSCYFLRQDTKLFFESTDALTGYKG